MSRDLYTEVTAKVVAAIEAGAADGSWQMPWIAAGKFGNPVNMTTGAAYRGVNILMLSMAGASAGYPVNQWASYQQWAGRGGQVRKGERGTMIVYAGSLSVRDPSEGGEDAAKSIRFLKHSSVFNVSQVDGVTVPAVERPCEAERVAAADALVTGTGAVVRSGFDRAYYSPSQDFIAMPDSDQFKAAGDRSATESYYGTLLHELTHWTGAEKRCAREFGKRFGNEAYAAEELVAELGAAFLCGRLGITSEFRMDHARYIASWLKVLKADSRAIFTAAARASDAVDYVCKLAGAAPLAVAA